MRMFLATVAAACLTMAAASVFSAHDANAQGEIGQQ
jgi:hypothetical protein